jgi:hypothetical protein
MLNMLPKQILEKQGKQVLTNSTASGQRTIEGFCEHGDETFGFIKSGNFFPKGLSSFQEDCTWELLMDNDSWSGN